MRKVPGARVVLALTLVGAVAIWAACSGSDPQDVVSPDAGSDATTEKDSGNPEEKPDSGGEKKDSGSDAGKVDPYDAGEPILLDAGDLFDGGLIPCVVGGELEEEPNDALEEANTLRPTRCGVAFAGDGGPDSGDVDSLTFELGDASSSFYLQYAGNVKVVVETDGQAPADISASPAPTLKFVKGQPYYVQVSSATGKTQTWRVTLFEK